MWIKYVRLIQHLQALVGDRRVGKLHGKLALAGQGIAPEGKVEFRFDEALRGRLRGGHVEVEGVFFRAHERGLDILVLRDVDFVARHLQAEIIRVGVVLRAHAEDGRGHGLLRERVVRDANKVIALRRVQEQHDLRGHVIA